jgi:hypothetical protein
MKYIDLADISKIQEMDGTDINELKADCKSHLMSIDKNMRELRILLKDEFFGRIRSGLMTNDNETVCRNIQGLILIGETMINDIRLVLQQVNFRESELEKNNEKKVS